MKTRSGLNNYPFLSGGGEMGELTRNLDWSESPVGTPDQWPLSLRTLISMMLTSQFPMLIFWGPALTTFYNDAFRPSLGENGKHPSSLGQPGEQSWAESWSVIGPMIHAIMAGGEAVWYEDQKLPLYRNGRMDYAYWTYSFSPISDDTGAVNGVLVTCSETTRTVENTRQLAASEQRFQNFIRQSTLGIIVLIGDALQVSIVNDAYGELIGRTYDELIGRKLFDVIPETETTFRPLIERVRTTGEPLYLYNTPYSVQVEDTLKEGYLNLVYQPYEEADGSIAGVTVLCQDVTEQAWARQQVEASEARFRTLINEAPVATFLVTGREMIIEIANDQMLHYWGKDRSVLGKPYREAVPELEGQPYFDLLEEVFTSGVAREMKAAPANLRVGKVPGTYYFDFSYTPLRSDAGEVYGIMCMTVEVTDQVMVQQRIEQKQKQVLDSFEQSPVAIATISADNLTIHTANPFYGHLVGRQLNDVVGKPIMDVLPELRGQGFDELMNEVIATGTPYVANEVAVDIVRNDQLETLYINLTYQPTREADGTISGLMVVATDVTQQVMARKVVEESEARYRALSAELDKQVQTRTQELQDSVRDLERSNENLQQFAYVASHDLQEPLRKIQSFGDILKNQYGDQLSDGLDYLQRMQTAASRMSTLIRDLLVFSRISTRQEATASVSLTQVVEQTTADLDLFIQDTGAVVKIDPLPTVTGDTSQLGQLFQNLLNNALKFRRPDVPPVVEVRAELVAATELPASVRPARAVTAYHRIDIADNGIGFDDKYVDRIFQVFQRLHGKNEFAGTGVGLAICEKVVANHGGAITATSQPGQGTTFSVYLPA